MKKLLMCVDSYIKQSDWKTMAALKFCLCAIGVMLGLSLPQKAKRPALFCAIVVFVATYVPLMIKFFKIILAPSEE